jgi:DNA-binding response OmpR family regulator
MAAAKWTIQTLISELNHHQAPDKANPTRPPIASRKRILIVDEEPDQRLDYRIALEGEGFETGEAEDAAEGLEALAKSQFDLVVLDMGLLGMSGLPLLAKMREHRLRTPPVVVTALSDLANVVCLISRGAVDFLQKPLAPSELRSAVDEVLARHPADNGSLNPPSTTKCQTIQRNIQW